MSNKVQVKGTLPLIAQFLNTTEKRVYEIFNLNEDEKQSSEEEKKGGQENETTNKSETIQPSENSI